LRRLSYVALVLTAAAIVVAIAVGRTGSVAEAPRSVGAPAAGATVETAVSPSRALFGDRLVAELRVTVDRSRVDPDSVTVSAEFAPFDLVGPAIVEVREAGPAAVVSLRFPIQCVRRECIPEQGARGVVIAPADVQWAWTGLAELGATEAIWPEIAIGSRVGPTTRGSAGPQISSLDPGEVTYGIDPTVLRWLLLGGACAVLLIAGGAGAILLRRAAPSRPDPVEAASGLSLADALQALDQSQDGDVRARRAALDRVAELVEELEVDGLGPELSRLAWSNEAPSTDAIADIAAAVRQVEKKAGP
jgi:hypothetical protein